jgi:hypothetical protein
LSEAVVGWLGAGAGVVPLAAAGASAVAALAAEASSRPARQSSCVPRLRRVKNSGVIMSVPCARQGAGGRA